MVQAARIDTNQDKELTKHIRNHLGNEFCPMQAKIDMLSERYTPNISKTTLYRYPDQSKEKVIEFSKKDMVLEMETQVARNLRAKYIDSCDFKRSSESRTSLEASRSILTSTAGVLPFLSRSLWLKSYLLQRHRRAA